MKLSEQDMKRFLLILLLLGAWGCSGDKDSPVTPDTSGPRVAATSPADGDSSVALDAIISVTFSEDMDPLTITGSSFHINPSLSGSIIYGNRTATLTPLADLLLGTVYTGTVTTSVTDAAGNHMDSNYVWSFTTTFGDLMPLAVGYQWRFRIIDYENPVVPDTTYDTVRIVRDTIIQSEQWFIDDTGVLLVNRDDGLWRMNPGGQPYLFLKFPGIAGQIYAADPAISESITIQSTSKLISSLIPYNHVCYQYISTSADPTVRWDYYYEPGFGPVQFLRYAVGATTTLKEWWLLIRFQP